LVVGGYGVGESDGGVRKSSEIYDPATGLWTATGTLSGPRARHSAVLLGNGKVLVAGGVAAIGGVPLSSCEIFDPQTNTWSAATAMSSARSVHTATLLGNGTVLVAGGDSV